MKLPNRYLRRNALRLRGFTLVELMVVVAIVSLLATLAMYGLQRYIALSKGAEALTSLGGMRKAVSAAYERDLMKAETLAMSGSSTTAGSPLCGTAANSVPDVVSKVQGRKYQPSLAEYRTGDDLNGWTCLKWENSQPQYYQYGYNQGTTPVPVSFPSGASSDDIYVAWARGDLDGDGNFGWYAVHGAIQGGALTSASNVFVQDPEE